MKIFLDLDGVFANFDREVEKQHGKWDRGSNDIWKTLEQIPNLFYRLELLPDSLKLITMLYHHDLEFLTALPEPTGYLRTAHDDKVAWIKKNVSRTIPVNTIIGGKNKYIFLNDNPGAVLIDDYDRNIAIWTAYGGIGIHHVDVDTTIDKLELLGLLRE